jgi:hypothetical protein
MRSWLVYRLLFTLLLAVVVALLTRNQLLAASYAGPDWLKPAILAPQRRSGPQLAQQTSVRPTLDPTRMPLTLLPIATIKAGLTATAQQLTTPIPTLTLAASQTAPLAPATIPAGPTFSQVPVGMPTSTVIASMPHQVPAAGSTASSLGSFVLVGVASLCFVAGMLLALLSRHHH